MDKVVRRTSLAVRQAQRKARLQAAREARVLRKDFLLRQTQRERALIDAAKHQRQALLEDWRKGPLAPQRDAGDRKGVYGAVSAQMAHLPAVPRADRRRFINIAKGDYVAVMRGKDKGKIGKVISVSRESESVTVQDLNKYEIEVPAAYIDSQHPYPTQSLACPLSIDDVRLVYPLYDPHTGTTRDTIISSVRGGGPFLERAYGSTTPRHTRYIDGTDTVLEWPASQASKFDAEPLDTPRILVEKETHAPTLEMWPFPSASILDELRGKYSVFRTQHEPAYLAAKQEESVRRQWAERRRLVTPLAEVMAQRVERRREERERAVRDEEGRLRLPQSSVEFIRQAMEEKTAGSGAAAEAKAS
ncbi:hypothetical protein KEM52_006465 [Ascosphaera acerosa]|nr:hypothetical protein KEM52_006465 [Ascosphaera acerosa]